MEMYNEIKIPRKLELQVESEVVTELLQSRDETFNR